MKKEELLFGVIGLLVGLIGGYLLTNWYNDKAIREFQGSGNPAVASQGQNVLSQEEIRQLIARADEAPENISFQKEVGISLYRYGANVQDSGLITEAIRILDRVYKSNPKDREALVALGNSYFDIGYFRNDNPAFETARKYYSEALEINPEDADVRVDYGLTYALQRPSNYEKAIIEYERALNSDMTHQRTLQMLTEALIQTGKNSEANAALQRLRTANPSHPMIGEFEKRISGS
jgi:tetratricopeptide (TPR) repeat protein